MRPTLHLTNFASRSQHGPGAVWAAMASAPAHVREHTRGQVCCHTPTDDVAAVRAALCTPDALAAARRYYAACRTLAWEQHNEGDLPPGLMNGVPWGCRDLESLLTVEHGDTLVCTCARPDTGRRPANQPFCHLEVWAPELVRAGWDVVLYGRRLIELTGQVCWADGEDDYTGLWVPGEAG